MGPFKAYDIRGVYPEEIDEIFVYNFALSFTTVFKPKKILVGYDSRISSKRLFKALVQGFSIGNVEIINVGLSSTPMINFLAQNLPYDFGFMITASHSPKEYNGIKISNKKGPISYNKLKIVEKKMKNFTILSKKSNIKKVNLDNFYISKGFKNIKLEDKKLNKKIQVLIDCSNGSTGRIVDLITKKISAKNKNLKFKIINKEPRGEFPIHSPNPQNKDVKEFIQEKLKNKNKSRFDVSIVLDADGDRILVFDEQGNTYSSSKIAAFIVDNQAKKNDVVVKDITCSRIIDDIAIKKQVKIIRSKVGRTNIPKHMKKNNAFFGIENSGHLFFKDFDNLDSGIYGGLKIIESFVNHNLPFSDIMQKYTKYEEKNMILKAKTINEQDSIMKTLEKYFLKDLKNNEFQPDYYEKIDGISIYYNSFWINFRKSNTEPIIRVKIEGENFQDINKITSLIKNCVG